MILLKPFVAILSLLLLQCKASNFNEKESKSPDGNDIKIIEPVGVPNINSSSLFEENDQFPISDLLLAVRDRNLNYVEKLIEESPENISWETLEVSIEAGCADGFEMLLDYYTGQDLFNFEFNRYLFKIIAFKALKENSGILAFKFVYKLFTKLDFYSKLALVEHIICEYSDPTIVGFSIEAGIISITSKSSSGITNDYSTNIQKFAFYWFLRALSFKVDSVELFKQADNGLRHCDVINESIEFINNYIEYMKNNTDEKVEYPQPEDFIKIDIEMFRQKLIAIITGAEKRRIGTRVLNAVIMQSNMANNLEFQNAIDEFIRNRNAALINAAEKGNEMDVKYLLDIGADVNAQSNRFTVLMFAAFNDHENIVNILLENGADVNAQDNNGNTALILTAYKGNENIVKTLVKYGADVKVENNWGHTASITASIYGRKNIVRILSSRKGCLIGRTLNNQGFCNIS